MTKLRAKLFYSTKKETPRTQTVFNIVNDFNFVIGSIDSTLF